MNLVCGIDVSKAMLDAAIDVGGVFKNAVFSNDEPGFIALLDWAQSFGAGSYAMEATGPYHKALLRELHARGLTAYCLDPFRARRLAQGLGILDKDDQLDARLLCRAVSMCKSQAVRPVSSLRESAAEVSRRIDQLTRTRSNEKTRLKEPRMSGQVQASLRRAIAWLDEEIQSLRGDWMELIQADQKLSAAVALILSVPNIGPKTVIPLLSELPEDILCSKGIVGLAGLAPRRRRSGTSLNACDRTSKACQTRLKAALYMPAIQALKTSPDLL
jgi:transposase